MAKVNREAAARMYARLVKAGRMDLDEVPKGYRAEVQQHLDPWSADAIA